LFLRDFATGNFFANPHEASLNNRTPLILATALLMLPLLYVGSYFALLDFCCGVEQRGDYDVITNYRAAPRACEAVFWPLEKIDRTLRPEAWSRPW